ncbi:MAG: OmpH family outer membrane protein [Owenweeksia sp.]
MKYILPVVLFAFSVAFTLFYVDHQQTRTRYVDLVKVYNGFELTKIYEGQLNSMTKSRKTRVDSLSLIYNIQRNKEKLNGQYTDTLRYLQQTLSDANFQLQQETERLTSTFEEAVWKQLNQFLKEYAEAEEIDIFFGANGSGNIIYGEEAFDATEEVTAFVNERFNDTKNVTP